SNGVGGADGSGAATLAFQAANSTWAAARSWSVCRPQYPLKKTNPAATAATLSSKRMTANLSFIAASVPRKERTRKTRCLDRGVHEDLKSRFKWPEYFLVCVCPC